MEDTYDFIIVGGMDTQHRLKVPSDTSQLGHQAQFLPRVWLIRQASIVSTNYKRETITDSVFTFL